MDVRDYIAASAAEFSQALRDWLSIPSICTSMRGLADAGDSGATCGEAGYTTPGRIWGRPTAEVNGLWGGHTGPGGKTIIPKSAHAKLSFRLVANQDLAKVMASLEAYVQRLSRNGCVVSLTARPGVRPCRSAIDSPGVTAAGRAMERAFAAVGLDADRIHAPNEYVDLSRLLRGAESVAYLWEELAGAGAVA